MLCPSHSLDVLHLEKVHDTSKTCASLLRSKLDASRVNIRRLELHPLVQGMCRVCFDVHGTVSGRSLWLP